MDKHSADDQESQNGANFDQHHHVVGFRGFANSTNQEQGENENDEKARHVEISAGPGAGGPHRA